MDYSLSDDQRAQQDAVRRYLEAEYPYARRGDAVDPTAQRRRWQGLAEMGLLGLPLDSAWGGAGQRPVDMALLAREMGRCHAGEGYLSSVVLAGTLLQALGSSAQREHWLPALVRGERQLALAHTEPDARYSLTQVRTRATPTAGGYCLQGRKSMVLGGAQADALLVLARTQGEDEDAGGLSLFLLPAVAPGLTLQNFQTLEGRQAAHITLDAVQVPADALLGELHQAHAALVQAVDLARIWVCAESVGAMETLIEATTEHLRTRKQFGAPLARFQALQHRLADAMMGLAQSEAMVFAAAMMQGEAEPELCRRVLAGMQVMTGRAAQAVSEMAIQMHGAMGMTAECRVGHFAKLLMSLGLLYGDVHHHTRWYAQHAIERGHPSPSHTLEEHA